MARDSQSSSWELGTQPYHSWNPKLKDIFIIRLFLLNCLHPILNPKWAGIWVSSENVLAFSLLFILPPQRNLILSRRGRKKSLFNDSFFESLYLPLTRSLFKVQECVLSVPGSSLPPHLGEILASHPAYLTMRGPGGQKWCEKKYSRKFSTQHFAMCTV